MSWKPLLVWLSAVLVASAVPVAWIWLILGRPTRLGGESATVLTAVSIQVALLAVFFLVVTFGIAGLALFGYHRIRDLAVEDATRQALKVIRREVAEQIARRSIRPRRETQPALGLDEQGEDNTDDE